MNKTTVKRPYLPVGSEPIFDKIVDRLVIDSPILNEKARAKDHSLAFLNFSDPRELKRLLETIKVEKSGIENMLKEQAKKWEGQQTKKINEGVVSPDSKYVPDEEERKKMLRFEAQLYCVRKEIEGLEKLLSKSEVKETAISDKNVLRNNCKGIGQVKDGSLILIDFMPVVKAKDGCLVIDCAESPYHKIATYDYITLVKSLGVLNSNIEKRTGELARKLAASGVDKEAIKLETDKLEKRFIEENPDIALKMIKWRGKTLPDPQGIKRHELISNSMTRTKK